MKPIVKAIIDSGSLKFGDFTLKSGAKSDHYFDLRLLLTQGEYLSVAVEEMWSALTVVGSRDVCRYGHCGYCGVPSGGLLLMGAMIANRPVAKHTGIFVRNEIKNYGTERKIEGSLDPEASYVILEDVTTTGSSVESCIDTLVEQGIKVSCVATILDRSKGYAKRVFAGRGIGFISLATAAECLERKL